MNPVLPEALPEMFAAQRSAPLISVIVPAHNASRTILRALDSARAQGWSPMEIIVVDDASTDGTAEIVAALSGQGVRLLRLQQNGGAARARNAGLKTANGKYIAFLDADDAWYPDKLRRQVEVLESNPAVSFVTCDSEYVEEQGRMSRPSQHACYAPSSGANAWKTLLAYNFVPTPTVLARRECLMRAGEFNSALPLGEDWDMWIRLALQGELAVIPEVLVTIYLIAGSLSNRHIMQERRLLEPAVERYVAQCSSRLTRAEIRSVRGRRSFAWGAYCFDQGYYVDSAFLFAKAAANGYRILKSTLNVPRSLFMFLSTAVLARAAAPRLTASNGEGWRGEKIRDAE